MSETAKIQFGEAFVDDQVGCARCGAGRHDCLTFRPFTNPPSSDGGRITHWATCPVTFEPVLLWVGPSKSSTPVGWIAGS